MIDMLPCVQEFYLLQSLMAEKHTEQFKKSHEKWEDDVWKYKDRFTQKLGEILHDYLFLICGGEARHAISKSQYYIPNIPYGGARSESYDKLKQYNPRQASDVLIKLFSSPCRENSYGGAKWANIAQAVKMFYEKNSNPNHIDVIIDHCVDLSHNGGICFNKSEANMLRTYSSDRYIAFLDHKRKSKTIVDLVEKWQRNMWGEGHPFEISMRLISLIERGMELGIIPKVNLEIENPNDFSELMNYNKITFGEQGMAPLVRGHYYFYKGGWQYFARPIDLPTYETSKGVDWGKSSISPKVMDNTCDIHCHECDDIECEHNPAIKAEKHNHWEDNKNADNDEEAFGYVEKTPSFDIESHQRDTNNAQEYNAA